MERLIEFLLGGWGALTIPVVVIVASLGIVAFSVNSSEAFMPVSNPLAEKMYRELDADPDVFSVEKSGNVLYVRYQVTNYRVIVESR